MSALNEAAKDALGGGWHHAGRLRACGCPDDRCAGFHHGAGQECGCLRVLLADMVSQTRPGS
jgi:hypothetical protein